MHRHLFMLALALAALLPPFAAAEPAPRRVLFVLSGHTVLGDTGQRTGYYLSEVAHPWQVLRAAGIAVDFVSPAGGAVQADPKSLDLKDPVNRAFTEDQAIARQLAATLAPDKIEPERYAAIYFAGGHGAMWDFPGNARLAAIAAAIYERGGVVAAVCHGPAGLLDIELSDGSRLVAGKRVTGFTNDEERAVGLTEVVPFLLQDRLTAAGATFAGAPNFKANVIVDQRLVTGQNPASAKPAAEAIVKLLE